MMHMSHLIAHFYTGIGTHKAIYPPAIPPVMSPHISADTLLGLTIKAKYTTTVLGPFGIPFIQQGSDSGLIVPHIPIPPPSVLLPLVIAFGASKPMFAASTVQMDGKPVAANLIPFLPMALPPSQQECNDPLNYPSDVVICPNTVVVGLTLGDVLAGAAAIVIDCAISGIGGIIGGGVGNAVVKGVLSVALRSAAREAAQAVGEQATKSLLRDMVENCSERALAEAASGVVDKLINEFGGGAVSDAVGDAVNPAIHEGVDGPPPSSGEPPTAGDDETVLPRSDPGGISNGVTGADGSDSRIGNAD